MVGSILKWGALGVGAVWAWRNVVQPWRARRAATRLVRVGGGAPAASSMKKALDAVVAQVVKLKVQADVMTGTHSGSPAILVKPANRALAPRLMAALPDEIAGVRVAVI